MTALPLLAAHAAALPLPTLLVLLLLLFHPLELHVLCQLQPLEPPHLPCRSFSLLLVLALALSLVLALVLLLLSPLPSLPRL